MKTATAALAAVVLAGICWSLPARAQAAPGPGPGEEASGPARLERCSGLHQQTAELQGQLEREYDPLERARLQGLLRGLHEEDERCR